jgi:hypothetical protein
LSLLANFSSDVTDDFIRKPDEDSDGSSTDFSSFTLDFVLLMCIVIVGIGLLKYFDIISWNPVKQPSPKSSSQSTTNPMIKNSTATGQPKSLKDNQYFDSRGMPKPEYIDSRGNLSINIALTTQQNTLRNAQATSKSKRKINGR